MSNQNAYGVVICGAGLAGLTLALQLRQANRTLPIAVVDRLAGPLPIAAHKVGEASTEIGSFYLAEILGLREYLDEVHYRKFGLRFFFHSSGVPFHQRPEIGLTKYIAPYAYNFDRGLLESDLRNKVTAGGVDLLEGCSIRDISISGDTGDRHKIVYSRHGEPSRVLEARWVVDAMGRRRFLQKRFNLTKPNRKRYSAAWFRMAGRIDISDFVSKTEISWHDRVVDHSRYDATNHLCGPGYWVWIIRLSSDHTSIGLVADEEVHPFNSYNSYPRLYRWLQRHEPELAHHLGDRKPKDFKKMPRYSYSAKQIFSSNRWACVGEAATFTDPLYGTGTDMIGLANCLTTQLIEKDLLNELDAEAVDQANLFFLSFNDGLADNIMTAYSCFGHSLSMAMKTIWDTMAGWAFTAPMLFNSLYVDTQFRQRLWPDAGKFFLLAHRVQQLFQDWAASNVCRGHFEFIDYLALPFVRELRLRNLQSGQTNEELLAAHRKNIESFEEFAQVIFLLALEDTAPHKLRQLPPGLWLNAWGISLDESRWRQDRLFSPDTEPRDLQPMWDLLRSRIHFATASDTRTEALPAIVEAQPITEKYAAPATLPEALHRAAAGNKGIVYLQTNGPDIDQSYRELLEDASSICAGLQAHGKKPDDIVILQLPLNQDFIPALWGCLLGGFIAAPVSVPTDYTKSAAANRFQAAWESLDKPLILSSIALAGSFGSASAGSIDKGHWVSVEELRSHPPDYESVAGDPDQLAILLLTSGSTGVPKAVQLRHSSILTRAEGRKRHFNFSDQDVSVNWFPLDHVPTPDQAIWPACCARRKAPSGVLFFGLKI